MGGRLKHFLKRCKAGKAIRQLVSHDEPRLQALGCALRDVLAARLSAEEREVIERIEQRRAALLGSHDSIAVVDYGAGAPHAHRTQEEMDAGVTTVARVTDIAAVSKSTFWATLLFKLVRNLQPSSCVELGSCVGISAAYQAAALRLNGKGVLVTLEGAPEVARLAEATLDGLQLDNASVVTGPFHQTFHGVLEQAKPIDLFFNDGHHDRAAVMRYFIEAKPYLSDGALIVFDDISWSPGMRAAWAEIEADEQVAASIDLHTMGVVVIRKGVVDSKKRFRIALDVSPH